MFHTLVSSMLTAFYYFKITVIINFSKKVITYLLQIHFLSFAHLLPSRKDSFLNGALVNMRTRSRVQPPSITRTLVRGSINTPQARVLTLPSPLEKVMTRMNNYRT